MNNDKLNFLKLKSRLTFLNGTVFFVCHVRQLRQGQRHKPHKVGEYHELRPIVPTEEPFNFG